MKEPVEKSALQEQMDAAAEEAAKELPSLKTAEQVRAWFKKWYMKAGYKRLSKSFMNFGK